MNKIKTYSIEKRSPYWSIIIIFCVVCIVTAAVCFQYYYRLQTTIREESSNYLQEVSRRIGNNIDRIINDNYAVLNTMAVVFKNSNMRSFADVQLVAEAQKSYWNYRDIMLIDKNGVAYSSNGKPLKLNGDVYLQEAVINGKQSMSTSQMVGSKEQIILAIPLDNMEIGGIQMTALAASYDPDNFEQELSMSSFNEQAYAHIISKDGTIIIRSTSPNAVKTGYNVLASIQNSKLDSGSSIEKMNKDIANNLAGQIGFTQDGKRNYMVYTPIRPDDWYLLTFVPANVVNAKSDLILNITLLLCGMITLVFSGLLAFLLFSFYRHKRKLEQLAYVDTVTGGNTIQRFYALAEMTLSMPGRPQYALVYTNFGKFKVLNEQLGHRVCDSILSAFNQVVSVGLNEREYIGRIFADNFCILIEFQDEATMLTRFGHWYANAEAYVESNKPVWSLPTAEFGVYVIDNDTMPFPQMIDRAKLALREFSHPISGKLYYGIYNDEVRRRLFREKLLEDMMEESLKNKEFKVYLQPKYGVSDEQISGAEALTRWVSSTEGMIYPDEFIPLFEKNGFILQLDLWVFEEVCRSLRSWIDKGWKPIKVSVNCSRVHLKFPDFLKSYCRISELYRIPNNLLEIELTESVVIEDAHYLTQVIKEIQGAGFGCSMDDFGSGYSSLNLIQDIPVDTLKLDKIFFRNHTKDSERSESVISSIVAMSKLLKMKTVAEGVEQREQVDMLRKIGCDYIQGYVYAKPMPIADFERLAFDPMAEGI